MFDLDRFLADCLEAVEADPSQRAAREVVARAVSDPAAVLAGLGEPKEAGVATLYHSDRLTVLNVVWGPLMTVPPHNHEMWAVIGVYCGREDNLFWRRFAGDDGGPQIEAAGATSIATGMAEPLGRDIVHSVTNPVEKLTGGIHVYGGDFYGTARLEWDSESHRQRPFDFDVTRTRFERSNRLFAREGMY